MPDWHPHFKYSNPRNCVNSYEDSIMCRLFLTGIVLMLFAGQAAADRLYLGALSEHPASNPDQEFNESHKLIAYERDGWIGGYFDNSYGEDTLFVGSRFSVQVRDLEFSLVAGASYGYRDCVKGQDWPITSRRVCPMLAPAISYTGIETALDLQPTLLLIGKAVVLTVSVDSEKAVKLLQKGF